MKNIILIVSFILLTITGFSQRTISDTIFSNETVSFTAMEGAKTVQATCTTLGDSIAGTVTIYGSLDNSSWTFLNYLSGTLGVASPKASITGADLNQVTMSNNLVASWTITAPYPYYKVVGVGTAANDTTLVVIKWSK